MIKIVGIGLTGAILAIMLRQQRPEIATVVSIATGLVVMFMVMDRALGLIDTLKAMAEQFAINGEVFATVLKIIGVAYIAEFGIQACIDAGEKSIAAKVELGAKVIILAMCAPLVASILEMLQLMLPS